MPVITFWSTNKKTIGQTVSASLAATVMAIEHNYKVLLISADYNNTTMENCFGAQESNNDILKTIVKNPQINLDTGINGLLKLAESNRITPEIIHDYTKIIFKNRLEVLYSPNNIIEGQKLMNTFKNIIINASKYYDYVIVDLQKGLNFSSQLEILDISEVVVANINQSIKEIEEFINTKELKNLWKKVIWNISRYDEKSKYNSKNLIRKILKKQMIYEIPYNTLVHDAVESGDFIELLIRLKTLRDDGENRILMKKVEELVSGIRIKYQQTRSRI